MKTKPAPTLATIADAAGYSLATVSRALGNHPGLPARTISRIQRLAERMGYRANPLVTQVMRHMRRARGSVPRGAVAYLVFGATAEDWKKHLTYVGFFAGAQARAEELGFTLVQFWADDPAMSSKRLAQILRARGITGVVIGPSPGLPRAPELDWTDFAPVKIGVPFADLSLPCAVSNHYRAMLVVIERLAALGYRRPGLVLQEHQTIKTSNLWLAPLLIHWQHARPSDRVPPLVMSLWREENFAAWFRAYRPDVVIGLRSELIEWLGRLGYPVPRRVGFVHLDRCTERGVFAGIDQKPQEVGAAAMDMLVSRLLANERNLQVSPRQLLVEGVWVDGPTLRRQRGSQPGGAEMTTR